MEILFILGGWVLLAFFAAGIAQGSGKWESEDFPFSKPTAKLVRTVEGKPPEPKRTNPSEAIAKSAEKATVSSQDPVETTAVRSVMQRQPPCCFENQSVDEVRKIMRELHLQYLVVLDEKMRFVGTVKMEDLDRGKKQDPPRGSE
jgi:hypothetical protein